MNRKTGIVILMILFAGCTGRNVSEFRPVSSAEKDDLYVSSFIDFSNKNPTVVVSVRNVSSKAVFIEKAFIYCSGEKIGVKNFKADFGEYLGIKSGITENDIVGMFNSLIDRNSYIDFICSEGAQVKVVTTSGAEFVSEVKVINSSATRNKPR